MLYPNNFIAHDIRYGQSKYSDRYSSQQKDSFMRHLNHLSKYEVEEPDVLRNIFLSIYSNPIENCLNINTFFYRPTMKKKLILVLSTLCLCSFSSFAQTLPGSLSYSHGNLYDQSGRLIP